jgi:DNA mismatch repair ATPase MutS
MKALLMYRDRDFALPKEAPSQGGSRSSGSQPLLPHERELRQDLELDTLLLAMAGEDSFLYEVARRALLSGFSNDIDTLLYRQAIFKDCLRNAALVRQLYDLTVEAIERRREHWWGLSSRFPGAILSSAVDIMRLFMGTLRRLRDIARANAHSFVSEGFTTLFATLERELSDEYLRTVDGHLAQLKFRKGVLMTATLGEGSATSNHVLSRPHDKASNWFKRILGKRSPSYTFHLHPRDEAGARIVSQLRDRGINLVANVLAQSADHVQSFIEVLRVELAFYVGCLNLHSRLARIGIPTCFPEPHAVGTRRLRFNKLHDVSLALTTGGRIVPNTVFADGKSLVIITGANQGGKSSFLRSIGLAQLMMQCGMFVAAESFSSELCTDLFTHYKREEDAAMKGGRLDEELRRMSAIADAIRPNALLLFNESFASTNEREGSEIARQIVSALLEHRIKLFFVSHMYQFTHGLFESNMGDALFLRAERNPDGTRSFKLVKGEPLDTSYGHDLYRSMFAAEAEEPVAQ